MCNSLTSCLSESYLLEGAAKMLTAANTINNVVQTGLEENCARTAACNVDEVSYSMFAGVK
jgi:hypothetical protein